MSELEENYANVKLEDGIVHVTFLCESYDDKMIDTLIRQRLEITKDKSYPMLSDARKVKKLTREARQRLAQKDSAFGVSIVAIIINANSKAQLVIFNFFNAIYKAPAPTKMFSDKEKALEWLKQHK